MRYSTVLRATQGKGSLKDLSGPRNMVKRIRTISKRYGVSADAMQQTVGLFAGILGRFDCGATFPITIRALARNNGMLDRYRATNIELAVHGFSHVDHTQLPLEDQVRLLTEARARCEEKGIPCVGFRSPYLRWNENTITAVRESRYLYDSSQALVWSLTGELATRAYEHVLGFYGAIPAAAYPSLPRLDDGLVRIPYCLPDDEALVDRLGLESVEAMSRQWLSILSRTYELGELFTLGLHPERIRPCEASLVATLRQARALSPAVWIARLDQIAHWWIARTETNVSICDGDDGELQLSVDGPDGVTVLVRGLEVSAPTVAWDGVYERVNGSRLRLRANRRPFIGTSVLSSPHLVSFLRQQGFIVEYTASHETHTLYLDRPSFRQEDERALLAEIEHSTHPLVRLGRWPNGARSALCVTGDIDAVTIWDYGLRLLGR